MKKHKAIEEQLKFDQSGQEADGQLYELLFSQLEKEKEISIRPEFSAVILSRLRKKHRKEARMDNLLFGLAISGVLFFSFFAIRVITSLNDESTFISSKLLIPALGLASLIIAFQLIDNSLLKKKRIKRHLGL